MSATQFGKTSTAQIDKTTTQHLAIASRFTTKPNGKSSRKKRGTLHLILVHLPIHASWLNQVEIYCSVIQRKVLTPNDFSSLAQVANRLLAFHHFYEQIAKPFEWKSTRTTSMNSCKKYLDRRRSLWPLNYKIRHRIYAPEYLVVAAVVSKPSLAASPCFISLE